MQIDEERPKARSLRAALCTQAMRFPGTLLLAGCAAGLSCGLIGGSLASHPASAATLLAQAKSEKASPFAAAKDEGGGAAAAVEGTLKEMNGSKAKGSKKNSPFAAAKDSEGGAKASLQVDRTRLWWLALPVGLAVIGYSGLRAQEGDSGAS